MSKKVSKYFESFSLKYQCGFKKKISAKKCLLSVLEKLKSVIDNRKPFQDMTYQRRLIVSRMTF